MADLDREHLSQYAIDSLGLAVMVAGAPTDVDGNAVTVTVINEDTQQTLFTRQAARLEEGRYSLQLAQEDTAVLGNYVARWTYSISGDFKLFNSYYAIGGAQPAYDNLAPALQVIVDSVWVRFADLFDSPNGGPNLATYRQTNWNRGRIAQLLRLAVNRLNVIAQPQSSYSADDPTRPFPTAQWGALLEMATFVEALKHLRRSYVEQPEYDGSTITRLDRRDYLERWGQVLADEEALMRPALDHFKIRQMGLGRPALLVSGGIWGRGFVGFGYPGMAARPNAWTASY